MLPYPKISGTELDALSRLFEHEYGLSLGHEKAYLFETRLASLMVEMSCESFSELYLLLRREDSPAVRDRVIDAMTTHETMWFRDKSWWKLIEGVILPEIAYRIHREQRPFSSWSCGCSTGQEAYSLAMLIHENSLLRSSLRKSADGRCILGSDVSASAVAIAKSGRFNRISMTRGNLGPRKSIYFNQSGSISVIDEELKRLVRFEKFNAKDSFGNRRDFDLVLCRNLLIYFSEEFRNEFLLQLKDSIRPGGYLVLGATERIHCGIDELELLECDDCVYYRRKTGEAR